VIRINVELNGVRVPLELGDDAIAAIAAAIASAVARTPGSSEFVTVAEAASLLRCSRQRIDDLLSQRRLTRVKEGSRTLIRRAEIDRHLSEAR
jgi:excisionase family DNA binding protein